MSATSPRRPRSANSQSLPSISTSHATPIPSNPNNSPCVAYVFPSPVAGAVLAIVSVSLTVAVRTLFNPPKPERASNPLQKLTQVVISHFRSILPPPPVANSPATPPQPANTLQKLDAIRDRAVAQLDNERIAYPSSVTHEEYMLLPPVQRRELLASAFTAAALYPRENLTSAPPPLPKVETVKKEEQVKKSPAFWRVAESVNGRAAALGFVLCLAREVAEPGHPSLFEQVVNVVVPVVQGTPPFLVAVCDRVVDLLT